MHLLEHKRSHLAVSTASATSELLWDLPEYYCLQLFDDEYRGAMAPGRLPTISGCFDDSGPCPDSTWYVRDAALPILPSFFFLKWSLFLWLNSFMVTRLFLWWIFFFLRNGAIGWRTYPGKKIVHKKGLYFFFLLYTTNQDSLLKTRN